MKLDERWAAIGQRVREARLAAGLSQDELAHRIGLDRTMVAKIEAGTRRVDAVELSRLSSCLHLPLAHFLYDHPTVLSRRTLLSEDDVTSAERESFRLDASLSAWLRDVRQMRESGLLKTHPLVTYPSVVDSDEAARAAAGWLRRRLDVAEEPIASLLAICERSGLMMSVVDVPGDGACAVDDDLAVAVVSRRGDPGRRRATAAHELGHVVLGDEYSSDLGVHASRAERESVVDAFAAEFLLPSAVVAGEGRPLDRETLVRLAAAFRTSWSLAVRQAVHARALDRGEASAWRARPPTKAELMDAIGWTPQPDLDSERVPPSFAHAVMEARSRHLVTTARAVDLMRGEIGEADLPPLVDEDLAP